MKFNYKKEASRVLDYILFPGMCHVIQSIEDSKDNLLDLNQVYSEDYLNFVDKTSALLEPYKDEIKKYYGNDIFSNYDFSNLLIHGFPIYDYKSEHEYLKSLMDMDESELKKVMIKTLISIDDDDESSKKEDDDMLTEANALSYINQLKIESSNKWNLLVMIQKPKDYLQGFIMLLEKVQSIFYKYYEEKSDEVDQYGLSLAKRLSEDSENTFKEITYDSISYDFTGSDTCNLYISAIYPDSLRFFNDDICRIIWGLRMEQTFKKLHEIREDKLSERIKIFKALGDKTRYQTLKLLANGISSIKDIANSLDVSSATISYHINEFLTSGIITIKFENNKKAGYKIDYNKLTEVMNELKVDLNFTK